MSCTEIYGFDREGNAYHEADIRNAWRGAFSIWKILESRHLPPYVPDYLKDTVWYIPTMSADEIKARLGYTPTRLTPCMGDSHPEEAIWNLQSNESVPMHERIVLGTTFDNVLVRKENLPEVIEAFRKFAGELLENETSIPEQIKVLERMLADDNCIAVGWNQTSVNADTWTTKGDYDEENDESIPYNCLTMDQHWWLFKEEEE